MSESVLEVPPMTYSSPEQEELGRKAYEAQKVDRDKTNFSAIPDSRLFKFQVPEHELH